MPFGRYSVVLDLDEVLPHLVRLPALVAGLVDDEVPIVVLGQGADGTVAHAHPPRTAARGYWMPSCFAPGRVEADVEGAVRLQPGQVLELQLAGGSSECFTQKSQRLRSSLAASLKFIRSAYRGLSP